MRTFRVSVDGIDYTVTVEELETDQPPPPASAPMSVAASSPATGHPPPASTAQTSPAKSAEPGDVICSLAGIVSKVDVTVGQTVKRGDTLLKLEAMKMNTDVTAPKDGTVKSIAVSEGVSVQEGQVLLTLS